MRGGAVRLGKCFTVVVKAYYTMSRVTGHFFSLTHPGPVKAEIQKKCLHNNLAGKKAILKVFWEHVCETGKNIKLS